MGNANNNFSFIGMTYALLAAVGWGLYVIYGSKVAQGGGSSVATGMFIAALFATPLGASHIIHIFDSYKILFTCLLMAMLASAIPFILDMIAMKNCILEFWDFTECFTRSERFGWMADFR